MQVYLYVICGIIIDYKETPLIMTHKSYLLDDNGQDLATNQFVVKPCPLNNYIPNILTTHPLTQK